MEATDDCGQEGLRAGERRVSNGDAADEKEDLMSDAAMNAKAGGRRQSVGHTPGPWEYIPSTAHHGPYVAGPWGGDICDCYAMSNPASSSVRNGGDSKPIHFQQEAADSNARLIAAAPDLRKALEDLFIHIEMGWEFVDVLAAAEAALEKAEGRA